MASCETFAGDCRHFRRVHSLIKASAGLIGASSKSYWHSSHTKDLRLREVSVSNWSIMESGSSTAIDGFEETNRESIKLGKLPENAQVRPPTSEETLQCNCSSMDDEMNYYASELWLMVKDVDTDPGRLRVLLDLGADPNKLRDGYTALHQAAYRGPQRNMELLIEYGTNVAIKTPPHQDTALHLVTYERDISKLKLLLNRRADLNAQNTDGDTTLHLAILRFRTTEAMQLLLDNGASMEIRGRRGYTPLQYAVSLDLEEKAKLLLDNGANPNVQDYHGRTPLHLAVASGKITLGLVKSLVQAGPRVDQQDKYERTAMHEAVKYNKKDAIEYLLKSGASREIEHSGMHTFVAMCQHTERSYTRPHQL